MAMPSHLTHLLKMERLLLSNISKRFSGSLWNGVEGRILVTAGKFEFVAILTSNFFC